MKLVCHLSLLIDYKCHESKTYACFACYCIHSPSTILIQNSCTIKVLVEGKN